MTPIEAMACKCAVVGSYTACMLDIGKNGVNAVLCEPKDTDAMVYGILKLAEDSQYRKKIAENGYKSVQKLDWNMSTEKFEDLLVKMK